MDKEQRKTIRNLVNISSKVRKDFGDMPVQMLETLLLIGLNPDISNKELEKMLGLSRASITRNIRIWTSWTADREAGPALVEARPDPYEMRRNMSRLTKQGEKYVSDLAKLFNDRRGDT